MSKLAVLQRCETAVVEERMPSGPLWSVWDNTRQPNSSRGLLGIGTTEEEAWADAAFTLNRMNGPRQ